MSDFLATLAAQALSAVPVALPLVPARYAPMPPIGGVGTLEGLRAGGGMAASPPEGPPPGQDRLDLPPPLIEPGAHDTAYYPFSYLQLQQAGGHQATAVEPGIEPPALATESEAATDVTPTEPAPGADAGRSTVVASSAPAGEPAYPMRDATGPPAPIADPLVAVPPAVQQPAATAPPRVPPTPPGAAAVPSAVLQRSAVVPDHALPAEAFQSSGSDLGAEGQPAALSNPSTPGDASARVPPTPPVVGVVAPPPAARPPHADTLDLPAKADAAKRVPPTMPDAAARPSTVIQRSPVVPDHMPPAEVAQSSGTVLGAKDQPSALSRSPEPLAPQPWPAAAARPEIAAVQPALGTERSAPAPDHVASPRSQVAVPAFPAKPAAEAEPSPRPDFASTTEVSAGLGDQLQALQTQSATGAMPSVARPEVVAAPSAARSPQMGMAEPLSLGDASSPAASTPPSAAVPPEIVEQPVPAAVERSAPVASVKPPPAPISPQSKTAGSRSNGDATQRMPPTPPAAGRNVPTPPPQAPAANAKPPAGVNSTATPATPAPVTAAPTTLGKPGPSIKRLPSPAPDNATQTAAGSGTQPKPLQGPLPDPTAPLTPRATVVAPPSAAESLRAESIGSRSHSRPALRIETTPPVATAAPMAIQRSPAVQEHALPAEAAKSLSSAKSPASQSPPLARPAESMAPLAAWGGGQTTADRLEQTPEQPAPAASVKSFATAPNAPASMLSPLKGPELARAATDGPEASRSRPGGEQAVVRPVLPVGSDTPAGQGMAGRNDPNREPAPLLTIRVTIGRIEVRSSAPALPAAASSPGRPRPALSLDDYLKQPAKVRP